LLSAHPDAMRLAQADASRAAPLQDANACRKYAKAASERLDQWLADENKYRSLAAKRQKSARRISM